MIPSKVTFWNSGVKPARLPISRTRSMSKPTGFPFFSNSKGGYAMSEATVICSPPPPPPLPWPPPPPPQPVRTSAIARTSATEMLPNHLILMNLPLPNYPSSGRALVKPSGPSKCSKERGRGPPLSPPILVIRCYVIADSTSRSPTSLHMQDLIQEALGALVLGVLKEVLGGTDLHDAPFVHEDDPVGDAPREAHLVGRDNHRHAAASEVGHRLEDLVYHFRVQG